ncbi:cysteinyl leukotriene receptor 1-like [Rhagoletis pomonella]|uniref:cysteinyl leukotriene receptor 1-like n=1 Tax=Rhagoletis pomonella TaxID=28610 RepID=UPI0017866FE1|nr:cysteinyl leukotriene receptor 1-like [Rhagoletis pomonella]
MDLQSTAVKPKASNEIILANRREKLMEPALPHAEEWTTSSSTWTDTAAYRTSHQYDGRKQQQPPTSTRSTFVGELLNDTFAFLNNSIISGDDVSNVDGIKNNLIFGSRNNNSQIVNTFPTSNTTTGGLDVSNGMLDTFEILGIMLNYYYVPVLVCTGSLGNILCVCVFIKTKLRKLSSSFYLAALAVSDSCFLLGLFMQWLNFVDIDIYNRDFFCQFFTFFSNLACFCSAWFVVAFTVERFIAVGYPLKRQTMCTVRRAKIVIVALTVWGSVHCTPYWISSKPLYSPKLDTVLCDMNPEYKYFMTLMNYFDTLVVFALPFATIFVLNTITGYRVWKFATVRRSLTMQRRKSQQFSRDAQTTPSNNSSSLKRQKSTSLYHTCQNSVNQADVRIIRRKSGE